MARLIVLLVLFWLAYRAVSMGAKLLLANLAKERQQPQVRTPRSGRLVACTQCGTHVVESRVRRSGDAVICESCGQQTR